VTFLDDAATIGGMCPPGLHWPAPFTYTAGLLGDPGDEHEVTIMTCESCQHSVEDIERVQDLPADFYQTEPTA
jgi:hypothetical protein